jgi:UDP-2,4-diacetamido-2,4,6-trideoxy-beta-L-altropyranose hydrolase
MQIVFRVDSSFQIGSGHVSRCLTLAEKLRENGANIEFICRDLPGNFIQFIENKNYFVHKLPCPTHFEEAGLTVHQCWLGETLENDLHTVKNILKAGPKLDWLIVDHYAIDKYWEQEVSSCANHIMVIDDLADRFHYCDLLLDQNYYVDAEHRYKNLVDCPMLLGPAFALLRPEFASMRAQMRRQYLEKIKRVFIFFGGMDATNETTKTLNALAHLNLSDVIVDVVIGNSHRHQQSIKDFCEQHHFNSHVNVNNMAELMMAADICIGAGGSSTWERSSLGLPSLVISIAENQLKLAEDASRLGLIHYLGYSDQVSETKIANEFQQVIANPFYLKEMSLRCLNTVDGLGCDKVVKHIYEY